MSVNRADAFAYFPSSITSFIKNNTITLATFAAGCVAAYEIYKLWNSQQISDTQYTKNNNNKPEQEKSKYVTASNDQTDESDEQSDCEELNEELETLNSEEALAITKLKTNIKEKLKNLGQQTIEQLQETENAINTLTNITEYTADAIKSIQQIRQNSIASINKQLEKNTAAQQQLHDLLIGMFTNKSAHKTINTSFNNSFFNEIKAKSFQKFNTVKNNQFSIKRDDFFDIPEIKCVHNNITLQYNTEQSDANNTIVITLENPITHFLMCANKLIIVEKIEKNKNNIVSVFNMQTKNIEIQYSSTTPIIKIAFDSQGSKNIALLDNQHKVQIIQLQK